MAFPTTVYRKFHFAPTPLQKECAFDDDPRTRSIFRVRVGRFLLPKIGVQAGLIATFLLLTWQGLGGGFTANPWTSMISKIIPPEARGTFFGTQAALANLFISGSAVIAGYLLNAFDSPTDFMACFLIAFVFFTISWAALSLTREPADHEKVIEENPHPFWEGAGKILKRDRNFDWFLSARVLSQFATMGFSFYIVYALRRFHMDAITAGYLTATLTVSQTVANAGMGWLGDRVGHRLMLIIGAGAATLSHCLPGLLRHSPGSSPCLSSQGLQMFPSGRTA